MRETDRRWRRVDEGRATDALGLATADDPAFDAEPLKVHPVRWHNPTTRTGSRSSHWHSNIRKIPQV